MLAYRDETTPPQYFNLMRLTLENSCNVTAPLDVTDEVDVEGRVRVTHMLFDDRVDASMGHHIKQTTIQSHGPQVSHGGIIVHGPSRSWTEKFDFIHALPCETLPQECEILFTRPRLGHYPKPETLQYARRCRAFLIPQGSPDSNPRYLQWRFSTSLIERQLVFDFTEVQHLTFLLLKMMRKTYIKPRFKDNLSTFHLKTVTLFVVESHSPDIWRKDNIVNCVKYCLNTLLRLIKLRRCPHFTTDGVNLFTGKFKRVELEQLKTVIEDIRSQLMWCIANLDMDMFGSRIQDLLGYRLVPLSVDDFCCSNELEIARAIMYTIPSGLSNIISNLSYYYSTIDKKKVTGAVKMHLRFLQAVQTTGSEQEREIASLIISYLYGTLASIEASFSISAGDPITQYVYELYKLSLDADLMSAKLKYASMLYCSGQFSEAASILTNCEGLLGSAVAHYCGCLGREWYGESDVYLQKELHTNKEKLKKKNFTTCVKFSKHEVLCVPEHLRCEMDRTQTQEDQKQRNMDNKWMDLVVIDCVPFLYYLQYLVYRQIGRPGRTYVPVANLEAYAFKPEGMFGHCETATHVLAHTMELDNRIDNARCLYEQSLSIFATNNVAILHLMRLYNTT